MPVPIALPVLNAVVVTVPLPTPPLDGPTSAFLAALAPVWPALEPWLIVAAVVLVMWIATEIVVRELHRLERSTAPADGVARARPTR